MWCEKVPEYLQQPLGGILISIEHTRKGSHKYVYVREIIHHKHFISIVDLRNAFFVSQSSKQQPLVLAVTAGCVHSEISLEICQLNWEIIKYHCSSQIDGELHFFCLCLPILDSVFFVIL